MPLFTRTLIATPMLVFLAVAASPTLGCRPAPQTVAPVVQGADNGDDSEAGTDDFVITVNGQPWSGIKDRSTSSLRIIALPSK